MVSIGDTKHAAEYLIDTVRSGRTLYGEHAVIRQKGVFASGTYTARVFDIWMQTPLGMQVNETGYLFFKRRYYEKFGRNHGFKSDPVGMSASLIPLKEAAKVNALNDILPGRHACCVKDWH